MMGEWKEWFEKLKTEDSLFKLELLCNTLFSKIIKTCKIYTDKKKQSHKDKIKLSF